jgi:hypothetical protein
MPTTHHVSLREVHWIDEAVGCGNVTSVGAAHRRLVALGSKIIGGDILRVETEPPREFRTRREFDDWVRERYPGFKDDSLHPSFRLW